jgi:hypothetical protein
MARRGLGGGVMAGGLTNLYGQRAASMANAYNNVAQEKINRNIAGQQELMQMYGNQQNLGQLLRQQAEQQLLGLGNMEAERKAQGQELTGQLIGQVGGLMGQLRKKKPLKPMTFEPSSAGNIITDIAE